MDQAKKFNMDFKKRKSSNFNIDSKDNKNKKSRRSLVICKAYLEHYHCNLTLHRHHHCNHYIVHPTPPRRHQQPHHRRYHHHRHHNHRTITTSIFKPPKNPRTTAHMYCLLSAISTYCNTVSHHIFTIASPNQQTNHQEPLPKSNQTITRRLLHTTIISATSTISNNYKTTTTTSIFKKLGRAMSLLMMGASRSVQPPSQHYSTNAQVASNVCRYERW
ncbi:Hypothetical predicted protein [Olea europaea subsp. europaea]|uniref:Uncharacterized protein n=1 Tax=Olea europaea subsp. europaea TaxID=158383 RepID=A0A8S0S7T7_OLEEU|nr:Hypothetical predicted protein [Olea europaea subsp. europaea]